MLEYMRPELFMDGLSDIWKMEQNFDSCSFGSVLALLFAGRELEPSRRKVHSPYHWAKPLREGNALVVPESLAGDPGLLRLIRNC
jgi:hypothetical protein